MASAAAITQPHGTQRWLYGPSADLLLGCGGLYAVAVVLLYFTAIGRFAVEWSFLTATLLAFFVNGPHYGATLLRVYEQREERRKYAFFAVHVTILLCALFVAGLHVHWLGSLVLTAYFTWTPWHFSGQNYGLAVLFLRRRGIDVTPNAKRALYGSFVLSCVVTLLSLHGESPQLGLAPIPSTEGTTYGFMSVGIPDAVRLPLLLGSFLAYLASLVLAATLLLRRAPARELLPSACLVLAQAGWFAVPALLAIEQVGMRNVAFSTVWIALAHSVQYLWVTSYFAQHSGRSTSLGSFLFRCLVAGAIVIVLPAVAFAPDALGPLPYDAGLAILLFSIVNLHHFILDGAIWKLRDGRIARVLIRREEVATTPGSPGRSRGLVMGFYAAGLVACSVEVGSTLEQNFGFSRAMARDEITRAVSAARHLDLVGRESARREARLASAISRRGGSTKEVRARLERSLELRQDADVWNALGSVQRAAGEAEAALASFEAALALEPDHVEAWRNAADTWEATGHPDRALEARRRADELEPETPASRKRPPRREAGATL
jgi:hypothetical protein